MIRLNEIKLPLNHLPSDLENAIVQRLALERTAIKAFSIFRRGYDARKRSAIVLVYTVDVILQDASLVAAILQRQQKCASVLITATPDMQYRFVRQAPHDFYINPQANTKLQANASQVKQPLRPIVIGFGPCGMFAALILAQMGFRPIVLERGKSVRERTKDTWKLWRQNQLDPESNVQFGEGGAGTFSDGKLYSQIKDPKHYGRKVLQEFVKAGAPDEILFVSKPHIGTFRLVSMVEKMRAEIERLGGEVRFQQRVIDFDIEDNAASTLPINPINPVNKPRPYGRKIRAVHLASGERIESNHVILAVGHSARDTFALLHQRGVFMEAKPFSIGLRVEHPQRLIDKVRFGDFAGHPLLGAADYRLVHHAKNGRAVYSFCMCPGGQVVAATSEVGRVVTNGMSQYSRSERNANAALVVEVRPEDFSKDPYHNPLAGIDFQRHWESAAFLEGGGDYRAPAQKVGDFLRGLPSRELGEVLPSYQPGIKLGDLSRALPDFATEALREAIVVFNREIKGFAHADALLTGVETRTSSPVRIKRLEEPDNAKDNAKDNAGAGQVKGESINTGGLFPAGEGAGYAGGIYSAAIDGIKTAESVAMSMMSFYGFGG